MLRPKWFGSLHIIRRTRARTSGMAALVLAAASCWVTSAMLILGAALHAPAGLAAQPALVGALLLPAEGLAFLLLLRRYARRPAPVAGPSSLRDTLTGLHGRLYFFERLNEESQRAQRYGNGFAIVMLDVDGLRHLNDIHGQSAGDEVLRALGEALQSLVRGSDLAARIDGDGFALLLPEAGEKEAAAAAERIVRTAAGRVAAITAERQPYPLSLSYGLAAYSIDTRNSEALLRAADHGLSQMKREKRRGVWHPQS